MHRTLLAAALLVPAALAVGVPAGGPAAFAEGDAPAAKPKVEVGAEAPDFTLKDQDGNDVTLSSYRGKKNVVVAFYPKASTPGCTVEMKCFTKEFRKVEERGAVILAVSGDTVADIKSFATSVGARFPMLSDAGCAVAKTYGVFVQNMQGGFAARSAFLVDMEGKLRWVEREYGVPRTLDGNELLAKLDELRPAASDPAEAFSALPSPEKETKTRVVRWVQAILAEDATALDGHLHKEFGWKPGQAQAMLDQRRKSELDRWRKLFDAHDLKTLPFPEVLDVRHTKSLAKGDQEKPGVLAGYSDEVKKVVADLPEGDVVVVALTKQKKVGDETLLPRELWVFLRKDGSDWKILNFGGR